MEPDSGRQRPAVSVVLPFFGNREEARYTLTSLAAIDRRPDDELIVVDNTLDDAALRIAEGSPVTPVSAPVKRSAYAARNFGAELARSEWLLFLDSDCRAPTSLLDDFFRDPIDPDCGAVAGEVVGAPDQRSLAARYARSRSYLSLAVHRDHPHLPMAATANVLVRREAWKALGGFPEGMTAAAGDTYFSWRLQEEGWKICFRGAAVVEHRHRETVAGLVRQVARNAAGAAWINRRYPGALPRPKLLSGLARSLVGAAAFGFSGQIERARLKLVDGLVIVAQNLGYLAGNSAPRPLRPAEASGPGLAVLARSFPERADSDLIRRLKGIGASGRPLRVEAVRRAGNPDWADARGIDALYWEDDGDARRAIDAIRLLLRHPLRCAADLGRRLISRGGRDTTPLRDLAPSVRRLEADRPMSLGLGAGDPAIDRLAKRLARLSGAPYSTNVL